MFQNFSESPAPDAAVARGPGTAARPLIPRDDHARIERVAFKAAESGDPNGDRLLAKIRTAEQCEPGELPDDVVSMEDFVTYRTEGGLSRIRALIYPEDSMWSPAEISVLTPLGTALLGQRVGDRIAVEADADAWKLTVLIEGKDGRRMVGGLSRVGIPSSRQGLAARRTSSQPDTSDLQDSDLKRTGPLVAGV
jgi:regulator of nucleoside diphosphate kinase